MAKHTHESEPHPHATHPHPHATHAHGTHPTPLDPAYGTSSKTKADDPEIHVGDTVSVLDDKHVHATKTVKVEAIKKDAIDDTTVTAYTCVTLDGKHAFDLKPDQLKKLPQKAQPVPKPAAPVE